MRQLYDSAGQIVANRRYEPFGSPLSASGTGESVYGFAGEQLDASTGLLYLRARYLDTGVGRFTQVDPSAWEANPYLYAGANPISYIDPWGLERVIIVYGDRYSEPTAAFYAAAYSLKETYLARGYDEDDILLRPVRTDAELLGLIENSNENEIEHLAIFSHGYSSGIQLSRGNNAYKQLEASDVDGTLRDRFACGATVEINACWVGQGDLPQKMADSWGVYVRASLYPTKFWSVRSLIPGLTLSAEEVARSNIALAPLGPTGLLVRVKPTHSGLHVEVDVDYLSPFEGEGGYRPEDGYVLQLPYEGSGVHTRMHPQSGFRWFAPSR